MTCQIFLSAAARMTKKLDTKIANTRTLKSSVSSFNRILQVECLSRALLVCYHPSSRRAPWSGCNIYRHLAISQWRCNLTTLTSHCHKTLRTIKRKNETTLLLFGLSLSCMLCYLILDLKYCLGFYPILDLQY